MQQRRFSEYVKHCSKLDQTCKALQKKRVELHQTWEELQKKRVELDVEIIDLIAQREDVEKQLAEVQSEQKILMGENGNDAQAPTEKHIPPLTRLRQGLSNQRRRAEPISGEDAGSSNIIEQDVGRKGRKKRKVAQAAAKKVKEMYKRYPANWEECDDEDDEEELPKIKEEPS